MGRNKSLNNAGSFYLRTEAASNDKGEYAVYLQYTLDRKVAKATTGVWVEEKYWDAKKQRVRSTHPLASHMNKRLESFKNQVDAQRLAFPADKRITIDILRSMLQGTYNEKPHEYVDFVQLAEQVNETEYKTERIGYSVYTNARCSFKLFRDFLRYELGEDSIDVADVTSDLIDRYIIWRRDVRGNTNETINKTLTPLMKAASAAVRMDLLKPSVSAEIAERYMNTKPKLSDDIEDDDEVNYLTEEQMKEFVSMYEQVKYPRTKDYMDIFLFSFNACGLRFVDMLTLQWSNIDFEKKQLKRLIVKGKKFLSFKLTDPAIEILERWKQKTGDKRFVFGFLPDSFDLSDAAELRRMRINKNTPLRKSLVTLGDKMGLPFNLTIHVARHTFAVVALNRGVDVHKLSVLLGHGSSEITEKIYAKFLPKTLDREVEEKLDFSDIVRSEAGEGEELDSEKNPSVSQTPQTWNYCPSCGTKLDGNFKFCPGCGKKLE